MLKRGMIRNCLRLWPFMNNGSKYVTQADLVCIYSVLSFLLSSKEGFLLYLNIGLKIFMFSIGQAVLSYLG